MAGLLLVLMIVQVALVIAFYRAMDLPILAALHPVNALILMGLSFHLARISQARPAEQTATSRVQ